MPLIFTGYLWLFGAENWQWMVGVLCLVPLTSYILYRGAEFPEMDTGEATQERSSNKGLWKCVLMIFMAGAVECTMAQWSSGYLEQALGIPKLWGDIFGVAMFSLFLGIGRTTYARKGGDIYPVLIWGTAGAAVCYLVAAVTSVPLVALLACVVTGLCVSMLWPGSLIAATERFPKAGMILFALMAAGGDMGASLGSQLVGSVTDILMTQESFGAFAASQGVTPEQLAMKTAMLIGLLFALCALPFIIHMRKESRK
jgi:fucose permease